MQLTFYIIFLFRHCPTTAATVLIPEAAAGDDQYDQQQQCQGHAPNHTPYNATHCVVPWLGTVVATWGNRIT